MSSFTDLLDYTPLMEPITGADIQSFRASEASSMFRLPGNIMPGSVVKATQKMLVIIGAVFIAFFVIFFGSFVVAGHWAIGLVGFCVVVLVYGAIFLSIRAHQKMLAKLYKFAMRNKLTFLHDFANPGYDGMIFNEGHARTLLESFIFPNGIEIGNYEYVTGSGKNRENHDWGYVRIKLVRRLPNMVLDAKSNNTFGMISNLPDSFSRGQKLELEGDFNKYFTLYAPEEYKTDALYVFTPDVMSAVLDSGKSYDMEIVDDNLMVYSSSKFALDKPDELKALLAVGEKIGEEIRSQSDYYADDHVTNRAENVIAEPGRRLKTHVSWVLIVIIGLVVLYNLFTIFAH